MIMSYFYQGFTIALSCIENNLSEASNATAGADAGLMSLTLRVVALVCR